MSDCKCNGTGWVKARIPTLFSHEYGEDSWGWAACDLHGHLIGEDDDPPADDSQPEPSVYSWEKSE